MQRKAFLSGQQLAPAVRPSRATQPAVMPVQAAAAVTKRLKAGTGKKKPAPRKVPNTQKGAQVGGLDHGLDQPSRAITDPYKVQFDVLCVFC